MRFVLIHGGFHGAWCWRRLIDELEQRGRRALAIDLPGHGARWAEPSSLADRRDAIVEVMESGDVLVGHSGGGFDITLAADAVPEKVGHLVYLAAGLPLEGRPLLDATGGSADPGGADKVDQLSTGIPPSVLRADDRGWLRWADLNAAHEIFYHDCPAELAAWAFANFSPAPPGILTEPVRLTRFWSAELARSYILCLQDRALSFAESMAFAGRLGVTPLTIDTSHSPFLSRPSELAELLIKATSTRPVARLRPY